jgi:hypothetical protein
MREDYNTQVNSATKLFGDDTTFAGESKAVETILRMYVELLPRSLGNRGRMRGEDRFIG